MRFLGFLLLIVCLPLGAQGLFYRMDSSCGNLVSVDAEFLYWQLTQGPLEYADSLTPPFDLGNAQAKYIKFDPKPGVRARIVYESFCGWEATLLYTYYRNHAHESASGALFPALNYFGANGDIPFVTSATADWKVNFQYADLHYGRVLCLGNSFVLHPLIGVRGAWIHQNGNVAYAGGTPNTPINIDLKNHFWGCGLKAGLDGRYRLSPCWSFFSECAGSLLWGHFHVRQIQRQAAVPEIDLQENFNRLVPTVQAALGIEWKKRVAWWSPFIILSAAVEGQYWWKQNHIQRFTDSVFPIHVADDQDLGLLGLTLKASFYF